MPNILRNNSHPDCGGPWDPRAEVEEWRESPISAGPSTAGSRGQCRCIVVVIHNTSLRCTIHVVRPLYSYSSSSAAAASSSLIAATFFPAALKVSQKSLCLKPGSVTAFSRFLTILEVRESNDSFTYSLYVSVSSYISAVARASSRHAIAPGKACFENDAATFSLTTTPMS